MPPRSGGRAAESTWSRSWGGEGVDKAGVGWRRDGGYGTLDADNTATGHWAGSGGGVARQVCWVSASLESKGRRLGK